MDAMFTAGVPLNPQRQIEPCGYPSLCTGTNFATIYYQCVTISGPNLTKPLHEQQLSLLLMAFE